MPHQIPTECPFFSNKIQEALSYKMYIHLDINIGKGEKCAQCILYVWLSSQQTPGQICFSSWSFTIKMNIHSQQYLVWTLVCIQIVSFDQQYVDLCSAQRLNYSIEQIEKYTHFVCTHFYLTNGFAKVSFLDKLKHPKINRNHEIIGHLLIIAMENHLFQFERKVKTVYFMSRFGTHEQFESLVIHCSNVNRKKIHIWQIMNFVTDFHAISLELRCGWVKTKYWSKCCAFFSLSLPIPIPIPLPLSLSLAFPFFFGMFLSVSFWTLSGEKVERKPIFQLNE